MRTTVSGFNLVPAEGASAKALAGSCANAVAEAKDWVIDSSTKEAKQCVILVLTHREGTRSERVRRLAASIEGAGEPKPEAAEIEFEERGDETVAVLWIHGMDNRTFNKSLYEAYANPLNTAGLALDARMHSGFKFEVRDLSSSRHAVVDAPEECYDLASLVCFTDDYVVERIFKKSGEALASVSYYTGGHLFLYRCGGYFPGARDVVKAFGQEGSKLKNLVFSLSEGVLGGSKPEVSAAGYQEVTPELLSKLKSRFGER